MVLNSWYEPSQEDSMTRKKTLRWKFYLRENRLSKLVECTCISLIFDGIRMDDRQRVTLFTREKKSELWNKIFWFNTFDAESIIVSRGETL